MRGWGYLAAGWSDARRRGVTLLKGYLGRVRVRVRARDRVKAGAGVRVRAGVWVRVRVRARVTSLREIGVLRLLIASSAPFACSEKASVS